MRGLNFAHFAGFLQQFFIFCYKHIEMENKKEGEMKNQKRCGETDALLDKLIMDLNSSDEDSSRLISQLASYLRPKIEDDVGEGDFGIFLPRILTLKVMSGCREALSNCDPMCSKSATYIIKSIVSYLIANESARESLQQNDTTRSQFLLHLSYAEFQSFWSLFFDLFDILNEKQYHLVEPFLVKLRKSSFVKPEFLPWLTVLIRKMIKHDNRRVVREGFMVFLNCGLSIEEKEEGQDEERLDCLRFLQNTIIPALKENVGWILSEPADFFSYAENFLKLLRHVSSDPVLTILNYVNQTAGGISSLSLYFFALTSKSCVTPTTITTFQKVLTSVNNVLLYRLTGCDRFLKKKIQCLLIDIISETHRNSISTNFSSSLKEETYSHYLTFLGCLDDDIFCTNDNKLCFLLSAKEENGPEDDHRQILLSVKQSPVKCKGFFRWILLNAVSDRGCAKKFDAQFSEYFEMVLLARASPDADIDMNKLLSISREEGIQNALLDFANIVVFYVRAEALQQHYHQLVLVLQSLFRYAIMSLFNFLNTSDTSQSDFLVANSLLDLVETTKQWKEPDLPILKDLSKIFADPARRKENSLTYLLLFKLLLQLQEPGGQDENSSLLLTFPKICDVKLPPIDDDDSPIVKNQFSSKVIDLKLSILLAQVLSCTMHAGHEEFRSLGDIVSTAILSLDSGTYLTIKSMIQIMQHVLNFAFKSGLQGLVSEVANQVEELWKHAIDLRKTDVFFEVFPGFCDLICQPSFTGKHILSQYSGKIFAMSESIQGVVYILTRSLSEVDLDLCKEDDDAIYEPFLSELVGANVTASSHGEGVPKCIRMIFNIWDYLTKDNGVLNNNYNDERISLPFSGNTKSRIMALLNIIKQYNVMKDGIEEKADNYLSNVAEKFLQLNEQEGVDRKRYFQGSYIHRFKQRIVQNLLILQPFFNSKISSNVMRRLVLSLGHDGAQPSVRYLTEWIVINILIKYSELHVEFFTIVDECLKVRPGFGAMFATIAMHAALNMPLTMDKATLLFFDTTLQCASDLLMSQNFIVRIYGNIALHNIFENAQSRGFTEITTKYQVIYNSAKRAVDTAAGNFVKIYKSIVNDFYVKRFKATGHFYFDVIFIYLPKILKMANDEIIHENDLKAICSTFQNSLPVFAPANIKKLYSNDDECSWYLTNGLADGREQGEDGSTMMNTNSSNTGSHGTILQVKNNPWKYMPISEDILNFPEEIQLKKRTRKDQLIVVASLIDCVPNLGGLCRTCEVFGVSKYVVSSLKILDDTQFKSLSMSSHLWTDLLEVPARELQEFIKLYSSQGYTVVACEQAVDSKSLNTFNFPIKTLLLLGNEKYGIPAELLHFVDHAVEIPQVGLTRSLNVHVSAALCIWQYSTQHIL